MTNATLNAYPRLERRGRTTLPRTEPFQKARQTLWDALRTLISRRPAQEPNLGEIEAQRAALTILALESGANDVFHLSLVKR
jgi:hypothetical protein